MTPNLAANHDGNLAGFHGRTCVLTTVLSAQASRSRSRSRSRSEKKNQKKNRGITQRLFRANSNVKTLLLGAFLVARKRVF